MRQLGWVNLIVHGPLTEPVDGRIFDAFEILDKETMAKGTVRDKGIIEYLDEMTDIFYIQDDLREVLKEEGVYEVFAEVHHEPTVVHSLDGTEYDDMTALLKIETRRLTGEEAEYHLNPSEGEEE